MSIPLDSMADLNRLIAETVFEFDESRSAAAALIDAIGRPFGDGRLARRADEFEGEWDEKRVTLREKLVKLQQQIERDRENWPQLDAELRARFAAERS